MNEMKQVIIDVDVGTDDYVALLLLLREKSVQIEAIVCSMGNTTVDFVCKNVVRLLEIVGRTDIPVFRGASRQFIPIEHEIRLFHGVDGFGGLQYSSEPDLSIIRKEPAAVGIAEIVFNNPNKISWICVGPLTNAALSLQLYDDFADSIKDMWIMGGNYTALGNISATAEFNFYIDPEAAHIVLNRVKKPIYLLTWETCLDNYITMDWRMNVLGAIKKPEIELLNRAEKVIYAKSRHTNKWFPCDAYLVAAFLYPEITRKTSKHNATIELHGSLTRGQVVLDHLKEKDENVVIIEQIDLEAFKKLLLKL